jgi:hypothetical protein
MGRKAARGNSQEVEISLRQGLPAVTYSKPGRASGAGSTAKSPGRPATGMVTGRRVIVSRKARAIMRSTVRMGLELLHGARSSPHDNPAGNHASDQHFGPIDRVHVYPYRSSQGSRRGGPTYMSD